MFLQGDGLEGEGVRVKTFDENLLQKAAPGRGKSRLGQMRNSVVFHRFHRCGVSKRWVSVDKSIGLVAPEHRSVPSKA